MIMIGDLFHEGITETIVTTQSREGIPNAAPMGIVRRGSGLFIGMYPGTHTYRNVAETGCLVANIVTDPMVYVISAFEDLNCSYYEPQQKDMPPLIRDANAWACFKADLDGVVRLTPVRSEIVKKVVPGFSRGFASVIDATITGTRLNFLGEEGRRRIRDDEVIVTKCGTPRDIEAMEKLKKILGL